jgi:pimeloyl-ACP methyl ester carboxylesterase
MPVVASVFDGTEIAYEVYGSGSRAIVLVHGWSCDRSYWVCQLSALSENGQVVAVDLAGHGESSGTRRDWTIAAFGSDVCSVVARLAI